MLIGAVFLVVVVLAAVGLYMAAIRRQIPRQSTSWRSIRPPRSPTRHEPPAVDLSRPAGAEEPPLPGEPPAAAGRPASGSRREL